MTLREFSTTKIKISPIAVGCWSFGNDSWWGHQDDKKSLAVLARAFELGINLIDTAPVYGRGHSEEVVGKFLKQSGLREKAVVATKLGLNWDTKGPKIFHDLKPQRMLDEIDISRKRLDIDSIDLYQVHWPDPEVPIAQVAELMHSFYNKGLIKAVGVSNYSVEQMEEFIRYCPLHSLQPQYSMFCRAIEGATVDFCVKNNIAILAYAPLFAGLLTGKFFLDNKPVPNDINRRMKKDHLCEPLFSVNKEFLAQLQKIAQKYKKSLTQLVLNWTINRTGITAVLAGARDCAQLEDNAGAADWAILPEDLKTIDNLLACRDTAIGKK